MNTPLPKERWLRVTTHVARRFHAFPATPCAKEVLLALGSHANLLLSLGVQRPFTSSVLGAFLTVTCDIIVGTAELFLLPALNRAAA